MASSNHALGIKYLNLQVNQTYGTTDLLHAHLRFLFQQLQRTNKSGKKMFKIIPP